MKLTIESTPYLLAHGDRLVRLWRGTTESGLSVNVLVAAVAVPIGASAAEHEAFERELLEREVPASLDRAVAEAMGGHRG